MSKFKIEWNENGVSIYEAKILYDAEGNEVVAGGQRVAVGVGDYISDLENPDPVEQKALKDGIAAKLSPFVSLQMSNALADIAEKDARLAALKGEVESLRAENAQLKAKK